MKRNKKAKILAAVTAVSILMLSAVMAEAYYSFDFRVRGFATECQAYSGSEYKIHGDDDPATVNVSSFSGNTTMFFSVHCNIGGEITNEAACTAAGIYEITYKKGSAPKDPHYKYQLEGRCGLVTSYYANASGVWEP